MRHALTIDVEDYYMSPPEIRPNDWHRFPSRLENTVPRLVDWLAEHDHRATFFVLGWVANRFPGLIRSIHDAGHEIGIHGWDHRHLGEFTPETFARDFDRALEAVRAAGVDEVQGFRAPSFSLGPKQNWVYDILLDRGFQYDASTAPLFYGLHYGEPLANDAAHYRVAPSGRTLLEIPITVVGRRPFRIPASGGFFLRLYPYRLSHHLLRHLERQGRSAVVYLHPWEAEANHPKLSLGAAEHLLHYTGLRSAPDKIRRLLQDFEFTSIRSLLDAGVFPPPSPIPTIAEAC